MSELGAPDWTVVVAARTRVLQLYGAVLALCLVGIGALAYYAYRLGPLVGPGVESSFGFAVAIMFLLAALGVHTAEATYRLWPLGRRFHPSAPRAVNDAIIASFLKVLIVVIAVGALAYLIAGVLM